ncbi:MAG TPA: hypothetical protein P5562_01000 [Candidatus Woesebacteria bacterium]|nr:hypothetical protein [Candidatus Woesebacteria bacterium]
MEVKLTAFKSYLQSHHYSPITIRNYLSDVHQYSTFDSLENYLNSIQKDPNYNRYLSSLNKYFQFCLDQHLINQNPLKSLKRKPKINIDTLLSQYEVYLVKKHKTPTTIKNYLNDIKQFINFCES